MLVVGPGGFYFSKNPLSRFANEPKITRNLGLNFIFRWHPNKN